MMWKSNLLPSLSLKQKLSLGFTGLAILYLFLGPIVIVITTVLAGGFACKKIADFAANKNLIKRVLTGANSADFSALIERKLTLNDSQKLITLLNAYKHSNIVVIKQLSAQRFTIDFMTIYNSFREKYDLRLLKLLRKKFLNQDSTPSQDILNNLLRILITRKAFDEIEAFLLLYPQEILKETFTLIDEKNLNSAEIINFLDSKKQWLIANREITNRALTDQTDARLINFLMAIFPCADLNLSRVLINLISGNTQDNSLEKNIVRYMQKMEKTENFYQCLETVITHALYRGRLDLAEQILQENPGFLATRRSFATSLLFKYAVKPAISELLLKYGADVNAANPAGLCVVEQGIGAIDTPEYTRQEMLDIYMRFGANLNQRLMNAPRKRTDMTLLGYLPFLKLRISNNQDYEAIKLQKFLALFLEIPGDSNSNGTLCQHSYMQDPQAYWDFLLDFYFHRIVGQRLMTNVIAELADYSSCLKTIYGQDHMDSSLSLYQDYCAGKPIILPIYITYRERASHLAVMGLLRTGPDSQLVVEADRELERQDFSVFNQACFSYDEFCKYARTRHAPIAISSWRSHDSSARLRVKLGAQKADFCPAISAKFALKIALFLCLVRQELMQSNILGLNGVISDELIKHSYDLTASWYREFCQIAQTTLLADYHVLDSKYIDREFLLKAEAVITQSTLYEPELSEIEAITPTCSILI